MKYIIEFEDEYSMNEGGMKYHQCKQVPYWSVSNGIIKNLTPYTEPDRKDIEDEVWEFAGKIFEMNTDTYAEIYNEGFNSYQDAKAKYEAWLKQKDEIRVGDEVKDHEDIKAVVLDICMDGEAYTVYTENRICEDWLKDEGFVKTGRHFDEVEELLKKMRGGEE